MKIYVCKACGRAIKANGEEQPKFCYADRMDNLQEVTEEEAEKMGIEFQYNTDKTNFQIEWPADMYFHPVTGDDYMIDDRMRQTLRSLEGYQDQEMERLRKING